MPSPSTPKRTVNRTENSRTPSKPKVVDTGQPLGVYDTNFVRDRVRQWQAQGGGVVNADDVFVVEVEEEEPTPKERAARREAIEKSPKIKSPKSRDELPSTASKREGRRKSQVNGEESARARSKSAPAKRVVSDAHWRTKRSPPGSATSSRAAKNAIPRTSPPDDGIRVKPISEVKEDIRRRREADKSTPTTRVTTTYDDGIRVYATPPSSEKQTGRRKSRSGGGLSHSRSDPDITSSRSVSPQPQAAFSGSGKRRSAEPGVGDSAAKVASKSRRSSHRRGADADESPLSASRGFVDERRFAEERTSTKSHRGNILSQVFGESKKIFSKQQTPQLSTPRVPSIEAWLSETPDPFVDEQEPPIEVIPPLRPHPAPKKPEPEAIPVEDPNKIWDALDLKEGTRRHVTGSKRKKRVRSSAIYEDNPFPADFDSRTLDHSSANGSTTAPKFVDIAQQAPDLSPSPSSLSRRRATRASSPTSDRRKSVASKDQPVDDDIRSVVSSAVTGSSVEGPDPATPLRPPGLNLRRPFPSTGAHRLSTIASVETFNSKMSAPPPSTYAASEATAMPPTVEENVEEAESRDQFDPSSLARSNSRFAKHADLISVLSLPRAGNKSIMSARSIRTNRSRLATATIEDLMKELATDEGKYMRELRTLVDGVIPVLLTCVLSKTDAAIAAGLFRPSGAPANNPNFTKPIVDMGIALERLKTQHKRVPQQDVRAFLTWAHGAQRVYTEYIKAWRLGFQDVVVNLAPATEDSKFDPEGLDGGLPRNKDGDVVNGDGERVDVAFLLKRPLVRLKYLSKTLKGINFLSPSSEAESLATKYQNLVIDARNRSNEERARLEDEAASSIDPTRVRDLRTLAPLTGVSIDKTRHVRARDHFNLALQHSSGQLVDCRVELISRDEAAGQDVGGDILICEVDGTGKWLLFPPVQIDRISARNGDRKGEIVVMARGLSSNGSEWQEVFTLRSDDEEAGFEWVQMLGLTPIPPRILRTQSFLRKHQRTKSSEPVKATLEAPSATVSPGKSRTPSPTEMEIPIGEHGRGASKSWVDMFLNGCDSSPGSKLQKKVSHASPPRTPSKPLQNYVDEVNNLRSLPSQRSPQTPEPTKTPRSLNEALGLSGTSSMSGLRRTRAKRAPRHGDVSPRSPTSRSNVIKEGETTSPPRDVKETHDLTKAEEPLVPDYRSLSPVYDSSKHNPQPGADESKVARPSPHRSLSSVPSKDLPTIPKARKESPPTTPILEPEEEPEWPEPAENERPKSASKLQKKRPSLESMPEKESTPPPTPAHKSPSPVQLNALKTPVLAAGKSRPRRSSSPLKHQYEPSTASESSSESETSTVEHNEATSVSDSSDDEDLALGDPVTPLMPLGIVPPFKKQSPQESLYSLPNGTLSPSQSASQAPYKTVPPQPSKASKTIASIFAWAENGSWESLHPDECSIVITPGLIEAYQMSALHSVNEPLSSQNPVADLDTFSEVTSTILSPTDEVHSVQPLIALELTPLVPLRRGTALDISIRSPPTSNSQITSGNNIMFRSRNPEECEALYALINHSRINNPTYIALQNARGPATTASSMDRRTSASGSGRTSSWFGFGRSPSYRASSGRTPSIAPSESSIGSMSSAFSALKRFSGYGNSGGMFNISRSTISSRTGSRANSVYTSSDNSSGTGASGGSGSGTSSPIPPGMNVHVNVDPKMGPAGAPLGLSNAKIRLYIRETASKWRDMGSARLTITRPPPPSSLLPPEASGRVNGGGNEKRVVVNGKTKGEVLLDVQLGESCFERVARTGIALSVWEDVVGPNGEVGTVGAVGGVGGGRARVYMIQMKSEAETAYTFSIVGKLRY